MHSVLFFAKIPQGSQPWAQFLKATEQKLMKDPNATTLAENVWLLNVANSPASLGLLIHAAENCGVPYGILPFENEPQWLPVEFDPK